jgi:hypothetical protein
VSCRQCTDLYQTLLRVHRDLTGTLPDTAQPESAATAGVTVQKSGEGEERKALEPPQKSTCPPHQRP